MIVTISMTKEELTEMIKDRLEITLPASSEIKIEEKRQEDGELTGFNFHFDA
jgi:hypothetical protein